MLLKDPGTDQEWDIPDVFRNLARPKPPSRLHALLQSIDRTNLDGLVSCLEDLKEQAKFCASTKSGTKHKLPASEAAYARRLVAKEWKQLEFELAEELCRLLSGHTQRNYALLQKAKLMPDHRREVVHATTTGDFGRTRRRLERDIRGLQADIQRRRKILERHEACSAPESALLCQALSHIGICGFRVDEYTGTCLQLTYEHPAPYKHTQFTHNLSSGSWEALSVPDTLAPDQTTSSGNSIAVRCHEQVLMRIIGRQNDFLQQIEEMELGEAILTLSQWLSQLDLLVHDLENVSKTTSVVVDWPTITISDSSMDTRKWQATVRYDEGLDSKILLPTTATISRPGVQDAEAEIPPNVRISDYLQSLVRQIS